MLTSAPYFQGYSVQQHRGSLVVPYLDKALQTILKTLDQYPRVTAIRVDLRFPAQNLNSSWRGMESQLMGRFFDSLRAKIRHDRTRARNGNIVAHDTVLRYVWAREQEEGAFPHYHCLLLLNRDAYHRLGQFDSERENLANRIQAAWASALGLPWAEVYSSVHFPDNPVYWLSRGDEYSISELFYRVSYFCKVATKAYGQGVHVFGTSRR